MLPERAGQDARDLGYVGHVVRRPAGQQLFERHRAELRVFAHQTEMRRRQLQRVELVQVRAAELTELANQRFGGLAAITGESSLTIVRREAAAARKDALDSRHPVGDLAIGQMT